jgi:hypothetical protein
LSLPLDSALAGVHLSRRSRRWVPATVWAAGIAAVAVAFFAVSGPHRVSHSYHRFVEGNAVVSSGDLRSRLGDPGNNRRIDQWKVALKGYHSDPFKGIGAGTYVNLWNKRRPVTFAIIDAHSLYVEVMAELGQTGLALLVASLLLILGALARGIWRSRDRYVYAGLAAALVAWLVRAGLDWDWEMPAITIWLFCAGGAALAVSHREHRRHSLRSPAARLALSLVCLAVALVPAAIAVSQHRLDSAQAALARSDCGAAEGDAHRALDAIGFRAEPHQVLAYCAAGRGDLRGALAEARQAVSRDPQNWRYHYDTALFLAASGKGATAAARAAAALNPRDPAAAAGPRTLAGPGARQRARRLLGVK